MRNNFEEVEVKKSLSQHSYMINIFIRNGGKNDEN